MKSSDLLSDAFLVRWDEKLRSLLVVHPDAQQFPEALVQIREATLDEMNFQTASQFIGERLVLLIPALRARYVDPSTGMLRGDSDA